MRLNSKFFFTVAPAFFLVMAVTAPLSAEIYTLSATASGTLGSTSFTDALMTFTASSDAPEVQIESGVYVIYPTSGTLSISGVGSGTFTDAIDLFVNQGNSIAGISDYSRGGTDFLDIDDDTFSTYDFGTDIGPIFVAGSVGDSQGAVGTTLGALDFRDATDGTFTASPDGAATPEPSSLLLLGSGLVGLAGAIRKKLA